MFQRKTSKRDDDLRKYYLEKRLHSINKEIKDEEQRKVNIEQNLKFVHKQCNDIKQAKIKE